jgi:hypothetical protein
MRGVAGVAVVSLTLFAILWWSRRRRDALRERPPEKTKLLRPAGYSLEQRLQDLSEKGDVLMLHLCVSGVLFGLGTGAFFLTKEPHRFGSEQLRALLRRFDERCRDVEF